MFQWVSYLDIQGITSPQKALGILLEFPGTHDFPMST